MGFSNKAKLTALAIVHVFETSKPFGDYSAVAVLDDGAGISLGVNQFTHRSGSLGKVVRRYAELKGEVHVLIAQALPDFEKKRNINAHANDANLKKALRAAGKDPLMQRAQQEIAFENYLEPALEACAGSDFELPLSLAVIYDSINHGSYGLIRDRVRVERPGNGSMKPVEYEREWISQYVRKRDAWLESIPRLAKTDYRTDFFLAQIARDNWNLDLPMTVHGCRLTDEMISAAEEAPAVSAEELPADVSPSEEPATESPGVAAEEPAKEEAAPPTPGNGGENTFKAYVPQIDTAKMWLKRTFAGTSIGAAFAVIAGLPFWLQVGLFSLVVLIVIGGIVLFIKYHDRVFAYIGEMNTLRATPGIGNPQVAGEPPK